MKVVLLFVSCIFHDFSRFLCCLYCFAGCSTSADKAVQTVQQHMDTLVRSIEAKKHELVHTIKQQCKAKLKAMDLHKANVEMMHQCAVALINTCTELVQRKQQVRAGKREEREGKSLSDRYTNYAERTKRKQTHNTQWVVR
jgi:hypothetical protein